MQVLKLLIQLAFWFSLFCMHAFNADTADSLKQLKQIQTFLVIQRNWSTLQGFQLLVKYYWIYNEASFESSRKCWRQSDTINDQSNIIETGWRPFTNDWDDKEWESKARYHSREHIFLAVRVVEVMFLFAQQKAQMVLNFHSCLPISYW